MPKPAARLQLGTDEIIQNKVENPSVFFKRSNVNKSKSIITIVFGFDAIGDVAEDSDAKVEPWIEEQFRDALLDVKNHLSAGNARVIFTPSGSAGDCTMTLTATLSTKIPGTGSFFASQKDKMRKINANTGNDKKPEDRK